MRCFGLLLLAALALNCAHRAQSNGGRAVAWPEFLQPQPGEELVPVHEARDIVGRYRDVFGSRESMTITTEAGVLVMKFPPAARYELVIGHDGTLALWAGYAQQFRRAGRTLLSVQWCYAIRLFERID